jgi:metaxin
LLKGSASVSASTSASPTSAADIAGAYIDVDDILAEANNAFEALSTLLAGDDYFFGASEPGMFDAAVFAYTYLILDPNMGWEEDVLGRYLRRYGNLVQHCQRLTDAYFAQDKS